MPSSPAVELLDTEATALLTRLGQLRPIVLVETLVPAAAVATRALLGIERMLAEQRALLRRDVESYLRWLRRPDVSPAEAQQRFVLVRLRFNAVIAKYDLFSDAITQRSEHQHGLWLAGLDVLADDALRPRGVDLVPPPVLTYLDRGPGAAIRRARTRLPGDVPNPVAVIRIPRERMVGHGVASSLVHEVGHQVAALLDLVSAGTAAVDHVAFSAGEQSSLWRLWRRWVSEAIADMWSVGHLGIASTLGLMAVVSLPRPFVFRINDDGPHPTPWIRVHLSCAFGRQLYPDPIWDRLLGIWRSFYPTAGLSPRQVALLEGLAATAPAFAAALLGASVPATGRPVAGLLSIRGRDPASLRERYGELRGDLRPLAPTAALAALGLARFEGRLSTTAEAREVDRLLVTWALRRALRNEPPRHTSPTGAPPPLNTGPGRRPTTSLGALLGAER